jgi:cell division protein FtsZ
VVRGRLLGSPADYDPKTLNNGGIRDMFEFAEAPEGGAKIRIMGVGGGGCNAINTMISSGLEGVEFVAANTDLQVLKNSLSSFKLQLGGKLTRGLGAGANPNVGRDAAIEDIDQIHDVLEGSDMVFIAAGLGGGTGTGAAPIVAKAAKEEGALVVAVVTKPFVFEGKKRAKIAEEGMQWLKEEVDTLITIPNQRLLSLEEEDLTLIDSFKKADEVLLHAARSISDLITIPGLINLDFADVKTVMAEMGMAYMGMGTSNGSSRAADAARKAISSPLLEDISISGARGILINITGSSNLTLREVNDASTLVQKQAHEDANIIFGAVIDDGMNDELCITLIATGFEERVQEAVEKLEPAVLPRLTENLALPTIQRAREEASLLAAGGEEEHKEKREVIKLGTIISDFVNDSYDIPTFLRNQAEEGAS